MNLVIEHAVEQAIARDDAQRKYETPKLIAPNARVWPVKRAEMRHGHTLRARMIEDLRKASLMGLPDAAALFSAGWTLAQIETHAQRALNAFFRVT